MVNEEILSSKGFIESKLFNNTVLMMLFKIFFELLIILD